MLVPIHNRRARPRATILAMAVAALCQSAAVHADDQAAQQVTQQVTQQLPTVEIIGAMPLAGAGQAKSDIAAAVQSASAAAIAASQALDLSVFMNRQLGGVYLNEVQNNPFQPDLNYRGYTASPLLGTPQGLSVYLDGVRLNQPFGDVVSWDLIPRAALSSLALMPGSNPLFGLNTLGGAVALQTKDGRRNPGTTVQATLGEHRRAALEFEHGGSQANGLNWYITGNRFKEDGWRDDSPSSVRQLFGKLGWFDARSELALSVALADNDLTGNGLQEQRLLQRNYSSVYTKPDETANRSLLLNLAGKHSFNDNLLFSGNAYYRKIKTSTLNGDLNDDALDQSVYQPGAAERAALAAAGYTGVPASGANAANTPFPFWRCLGNVLTDDEPAEKCNGLYNRSRTAQENYGLSGQLTWSAAAHDVTVGAGYDASRSHFRQSSQFGYITPDHGVTPVDFYADGSEFDDDGSAIDNRVDLKGRVRTWSLFASDSVALGGAWHVNLSGRYNRSTIRNRDQLTPGGGSGSLDGDHHFARFNPAVGLVFKPTPAFNAYAGYNEGSRTPTAIELGCADPANPCRLPNAMAGDPPLKQVVTKTWEAGLRGALSNSSNWSAGLFRAENHNDILFVADDQAGFGYFKNFGKTRHQGLELALDTKLGAWTFGANYTLLDATYQSAETVNGAANSSSDAEHPGLDGNIAITPGNRIPLTPRHIFKARADYSAGPWTVGLGLSALSGSYARGNENNQHAASGLHYLGSGKTAGYAIADLGATYRATRNLTLFAQVNNLFDRKYATAAQLGATGFDGNGNFVARPFAAVGGEYPLVNSTFYAPGAPRMLSAGLRYAFGNGGAN